MFLQVSGSWPALLPPHRIRASVGSVLRRRSASSTAAAASWSRTIGSMTACRRRSARRTAGPHSRSSAPAKSTWTRRHGPMQHANTTHAGQGIVTCFFSFANLTAVHPTSASCVLRLPPPPWIRRPRFKWLDWHASRQTFATVGAPANKHLISLHGTLGFLGLKGFVMKNLRFPDEESIEIVGFQGLDFLRKFLVACYCTHNCFSGAREP